MQNEKVISQINADIEKGIYTNFPELKNKLEYIMKKLIHKERVVNSTKSLSWKEKQVLRENNYI